MSKKINKTEIKIRIQLTDAVKGARANDVYGSVFIEAGERVQDILNDERRFLPVHVKNDRAEKTVLISKDIIGILDEL
jgi:hypothetical protein